MLALRRVDGHPANQFRRKTPCFRARRIVPASSFLLENVEEDSIGSEPGERHYELEGTDRTGTASISCFSTLKTSGY